MKGDNCNSFKTLVKELFLIKFQKRTPLQLAFKERTTPSHLQGSTIYISCTIPSQKSFVPNLIVLSVVQERSLQENNYSESFDKTKKVVNVTLTI